MRAHTSSSSTRHHAPRQRGPCETHTRARPGVSAFRKGHEQGPRSRPFSPRARHTHTSPPHNAAHLYSLVVGGAEQHAAVRREAHTPHRARVRLERGGTALPAQAHRPPTCLQEQCTEGVALTEKSSGLSTSRGEGHRQPGLCACSFPFPTPDHATALLSSPTQRGGGGRARPRGVLTRWAARGGWCGPWSPTR